jgi:SpoVK/Ycf46/Vps4 family AAA+-type ATPase
MSGRHLKAIIEAYGTRDNAQFERATRAIIHEEENKRHTTLAKELGASLSVALNRTAPVGVYESPILPEPPVDRDSSIPLASVTRPDVHLGDLMLNDDSKGAIEGYIHEVRNWNTLDSAGIPRRNRVLLSGPPGCGKNSTAKALAFELSRPLVTVKVESLISSYLGETAANISKLFDFAATGSYVLFLDEFDSLGKARNDPSDHGETRRIVNAILQKIDAYAGPSIIVAATNYSEVLDSALWRRFDVVENLPLPTASEIKQVIERQLTQKNKDIVTDERVDKLVGLPHSAAEFAVNSARRRAALSGVREVSGEFLDAGIAETVGRRWL